MKRIFLRKYNRLITFFLSILGVGGACTFLGCEYGTPAVEYGVPNATYKVQGTVTSENNVNIPNIRVIMEYDTVYTDVNGDYIVQMSHFPGDHNLFVEFSDVDGASNGSYHASDTVASFQNPEYENGDGSWYSGEVSKEINIKLKEDN